MSILSVDQAKCTKCGMCIEVCPSRIIAMGENGPESTLDERCIACGHCVAICPQEAMDNEKTPLAEQILLQKYPVLDASTAATFLRSRRSIRCFKKEPVAHDTMLKILDIARYAETASNSQGLSYLVLEDPEILPKIIAAIIGWMDEQFQSGTARTQRYQSYVKLYRESGNDPILRGAHTLVLVLANEDNGNGWDSARISLTYIELYATTLGIGTVWGGFVESCVKGKYPPLMELLPIPQGKKVCGAMMAGYPKYKFKRLIERNPLEVIWG